MFTSMCRHKTCLRSSSKTQGKRGFMSFKDGNKMETPEQLVPRQLQIKYRQYNETSWSPVACPSILQLLLDIISLLLSYPYLPACAGTAPSVNAFCPYKEREQADCTMWAPRGCTVRWGEGWGGRGAGWRATSDLSLALKKTTEIDTGEEEESRGGSYTHMGCFLGEFPTYCCLSMNVVLCVWEHVEFRRARCQLTGCPHAHR